jgi:hypothetical protein
MQTLNIRLFLPLTEIWLAGLYRRRNDLKSDTYLLDNRKLIREEWPDDDLSQIILRR